MDKKVDIMFGNIHPNPHIKAFSDINHEDQLALFDASELQSWWCLYPSKNAMNGNMEIEQYRETPYTFELASGVGQLDFRVFDLSVLEYYRNDPRYTYHTSFIDGSISISDEYYWSDEMRVHDKILLQSFGFAFSDDMRRHVAVFIRYLHSLSKQHQQIWKANEVDVQCKLHPDYFRSSLFGEFPARISIFDAFCMEIAITNQMSEAAFGRKLYQREFDAPYPIGFGFLLRHTSAEFGRFVLLLDQMMSENLDKKFFEGQIATASESRRSDGKIVVTQIGTIKLLEAWLNKFYRSGEAGVVEEVIGGFKEIRKLRQKPAHNISNNVFDRALEEQQRQLMIRAYKAIRTLRLILANHPKVIVNPPEIDERLRDGNIWDY